MLYIVLMPIKTDGVRNLAVIRAKNFTTVSEILGLPRGWMSWVGITDLEYEAIVQSEHHYLIKFICKDPF